MRKAILILALLPLLVLILLQAGCSEDEDPVEIPPDCKITIDSPGAVSGEGWCTGLDINIRWTKTTGDNVKIELYKGANLAGIISPSTPNDGFYPWINCTTFSEGSSTDYSIRVTHLSDAACNDQSGTFTLTDVSNCAISFPWTPLRPVGDLTAGIDFDIIWDSDNTSGLVNLELWYEPFAALGELVGIIAENVANTGSYAWTVDSFNRGTSEGYRFKIQDSDDCAASCNDVSITFMITDEDNCSIDVLGISDGASYNPDQTIPLTFGLENSSGVVKLELFSGAVPVTGGQIIAGFDTQNGTATYNWVVDDFGHNGPAFDRYNILATDVNDEYCVSQDGSDFEITR